jgi:hypothetical protein
MHEKSNCTLQNHEELIIIKNLMIIEKLSHRIALFLNENKLFGR